MIALTAPTAIMIYLGVTLGSLLLLWFISHLYTRNAKLLLTEHQLYECEFCQNLYLDQKSVEVTQCPQCESFNKENKYKK